MVNSRDCVPGFYEASLWDEGPAIPRRDRRSIAASHEGGVPNLLKSVLFWGVPTPWVNSGCRGFEGDGLGEVVRGEGPEWARLWRAMLNWLRRR
jgi:hypothetical protein